MTGNARMRGRAGQAALARRKAMFPACAECAKRGLVRPTKEIDHVVPLALGGQDVDANCQGLCLPCHAVKTAFEQASTGGAANHPEWLSPAACHLTIVTGPPCGGKSTMVASLAHPDDLVIDLDELADRIAPGFLLGRRWTGEILNSAIRARNALLGSLARMPAHAEAYFIVSAPTADERDWWAHRLAPKARHHVDPGRFTCHARAIARGGGHHLQAVDDWYIRSHAPWRRERPSVRRVAIGADGYPVEAKS